MFSEEQYRLIDFGDGKKLELFAGTKIVRSCPAAEDVSPTTDEIHDQELLCHVKRNGQWRFANRVDEHWKLNYGSIKFGLKLTPFGHLGVFPEQACNWDWIQSLPFELSGLKALNLFAYTGGTSMALAQKGAEVTHVDSAKNIVRWASNNARLSGLCEATIRWIVEDALKFVAREIRRGNRYDIVVADPPAIGHAGQKMTWKIDRDLEELIRMLSELSSDSAKVVLLSCHSQGVNPRDLHDNVIRHFKLDSKANLELGKMDLTSADGRKLNCGQFLRWHC